MNDQARPGGRLEGKVALITGGARGMGESHARVMHAHGAAVVIGDILDEEGEALAAELGGAARYVHLDVTQRDQWAAAVKTATSNFGKLNVLVNNAGIATVGKIGSYEPELWDQIIAINLTGAFNGITAAVDSLIAAAPSSIVNVSSTAGLKGYPGASGYSAAKFGLRGLTRCVALDLGRHNVRCNSVHPGTVATPMNAHLVTEQWHVALQRIGQSGELSMLVVFLASDESSFCTGAEFVADGGELAGLSPGSREFLAQMGPRP